MSESSMIGRRAVFAALAALTTPQLARASEAADLATKLYRYRGFEGGNFSFNLKTETFRPGRATTWNEATVYFRSHDQVRIEFRNPSTFAGRRLLFDGPQLWLRVPDSQRLIRLTLADRLMGEASNGDAVNADFRRYDIQLAARETLEGRALARLVLTAKPGAAVAYPRLEYLVDPDTGRPARSQHFAASGKLLKIGTFEEFQTIGERSFVRVLTLSDPMNPGRYTRLTHSAYRQRGLPNAIFDKAGLDAPFT